MEEENGEVYSTIFSALRHGVRRNILRMLDKQELPFSAMEEALSLSSSHLTYHLDALKELVSKTETGYKLSVFGQAAVDMIERVENPPQEIAKRRLRYKQISIILLAATLLTSGLFGYTQLQLNTLNKIQTDQNNQIAVLSEKLAPYEALCEQLLTRPETFYSQGYRIVSGSYLQEDKRDNIAFFNPFNNSLLIMKSITYPATNCRQRLFLQDGNAYHNESGILVDWLLHGENIGDTHIQHNITVWETPTVWSSDVFSGGTYMVEIDEGWYTLSLGSPVRYSSSALMWGRNSTCRDENQIYQFKSWVDFKIEKDGELSPFIVECIFPD